MKVTITLLLSFVLSCFVEVIASARGNDKDCESVVSGEPFRLERELAQKLCAHKWEKLGNISPLYPSPQEEFRGCVAKMESADGSDLKIAAKECAEAILPSKNVDQIKLMVRVNAKRGVDKKCAEMAWSCEESKNCEDLKLFIENGKPAVSPKAVELVKKNLSEIMTEAMINRIDPRALIGAILIANTVNPDLTESIGPLRPLVNKMKKLAGNRTFYGIGRLSVNAAMEIENSGYPKKWDPTNLGGTTTKEMAARLENDSEALNKAAQYIRYMGDVYKDHQMIIGDRSEVLATLYSLGKVEERASMTKKSGGEPRVNTWGVLQACNADVIRDILATAKDSKDGLVEGKYVFLPSNANVTDWKYKNLKLDGTFDLEDADLSKPSSVIPVTPVK